MPKMQLDKLAEDLIASRCFDIPAIVLLLHQRVNQAPPASGHRSATCPPACKTKFHRSPQLEGVNQ
jgi:hypothetical protein